MSDNDKEIEAAIRAFEEVDELFNEDFARIYGNESDRLELFFKHLKINTGKWEKPALVRKFNTIVLLLHLCAFGTKSRDG